MEEFCVFRHRDLIHRMCQEPDFAFSWARSCRPPVYYPNTNVLLTDVKAAVTPVNNSAVLLLDKVAWARRSG